MKRSAVPAKPVLQIVLQGEARQLRDHLDLNHIVYELVDQVGPMTLRVAAADWPTIRAAATERGFSRPNFFCQPDGVGKVPFGLYWLQHKSPVSR